MSARDTGPFFSRVDRPTAYFTLTRVFLCMWKGCENSKATRRNKTCDACKRAYTEEQMGIAREAEQAALAQVVVEQVTRKCAHGDCGVWFVPARSNQKYCQRECSLACGAHRERTGTARRRAKRLNHGVVLTDAKAIERWNKPREGGSFAEQEAAYYGAPIVPRCCSALRDVEGLA